MASGYISTEYNSGEKKNRIDAPSAAGLKLFFSLLFALVALAYGSRSTLAAATPARGVAVAVAAAPLTGAITNTVTVGSSTFDPNPANNTAVQTTTVTVAPTVLPTVTLAATRVVSEGASGLITVTLTMTSNQPVTVTLVYSNVTTDGSDYLTSTLIIVIPAGQLSATAPFTATVDTLAETAEDFVVAISQVVNAHNGSTPQPVTIVDNTPLNTPTATPTTTATETPTETLTATPSPTDTATATATPTATSTVSATATVSDTSTPTATETVTPSATPTPSDTPTATVTATATVTDTATATPTASATVTPSATASATRTPTVTETATLTATSTVAVTATPTPSPVSTPTATDTVTVVPTPSATATHTPTATDTATATPSATVALVDTATATPSATATGQGNLTTTPFPTRNALETLTPQVTATPSTTRVISTATLVPTGTATPSATLSPTPSATATATATPTATLTATPTATPSFTATATASPTVTATSTPVPTATATPTTTPSATAIDTPTATATPTFTPTATATPTASPTDTATATETATLTPSPTATATVTPIPTATATATATPIPPATLGDLVWLDLNANGLQEPGEPGLATVQVTLYRADGALVATTVTDGSGFYHFTGVAPGDYFLVFTPPVVNGQTYAFSPVDQGDQSSGGAVDSDANPANGQTAIIHLSPGQTDSSWDAGCYPPLRLGNLVWHDKNNNGVVDSDEPGLPNVTVQLFRESMTPGNTAALTTGETINNVDATGDTPVATTTTDANGYYRFDNLSPGRYFVYIPTPPVGYPVSSIPTDTLDNSEDSDDNGNQVEPGGAVRGPVVDLQPQRETTNDGDDANGDLTQDFGFFAYATIGDLVWYDHNRDGLQGANETSLPGLADTVGVPGIAVTLYDAATNQIVATSITDSQGHYRFTQLLPGSYYVHFAPPSGYSMTVPHASLPNTGAPSDAFDSDVDPATQNTPVFVLSSGENKPTLDLGIYLLDDQQPAILGDWVWYDVNANGVQDAGESGVPGVTVNLYRSDGTLVATTKTDIEGYYLFTGLLPGDYYLSFVPAAGYVLTQPNQGDQTIADVIDSDVDPATGQTAIIRLGVVQTDLTQDAGLLATTPPGSLRGMTWFDANQNGIREPGDSSIPGVTVALYSADGTLVATTVTGADGQYAFINLSPGDYTVRFETPDGYRATTANQGNDDTVDSDALTTADGWTAQTPVVTLHAGESLSGLDYGILPTDPSDPRLQVTVKIGNHVWLDTNANGTQDPDEVGIADIVVKLYSSSGELLATTKTDSNGNYLFSNLPAASYFVEFVIPDNYVFSPFGSTIGSDSDSNAEPSTGRTALITLSPGTQDLTWDAGIYQKPTSLDEGAEPSNPTSAVYLPLAARKGLKVKPKEGVPKAKRSIPCDRNICFLP